VKPIKPVPTDSRIRADTQIARHARHAPHAWHALSAVGFIGGASDAPLPSLAGMDLGDADQRTALKHHLGGLLRGHKVLAGPLPLAAFTGWVAVMRAAGAQRPLIVASSLGAGPVPTAEDAEIVMIETRPYPSMTEELRHADQLARHLPQPALDAIAAYDPDREAVWLHGPFVRDEPIDGRRVIGGRPAAWLELEDKLVHDRVWAAVGAPHAASRVAAVEHRELERVSTELDEGAGVVWAGDARDGFNGGGDFTRWVVDRRDRARALEFFAPRCDHVRVMPFLDGVPCSIHGFVLPDGVVAFRPVELSILRGERRRFVYGGQGTTWDPPDADREQMRELVRRTGEHLRAEVGYRGAFGIDGVMTAAGFRPTEINTRFSGGLAALATGLDQDLLTMLQFACLSCYDPGVTATDLEAWALPELDRARLTKVIGMSSRRAVEEPCEVAVTWDGTALHRAAAAGEESPKVMLGPTAVGCFVRLSGDLVSAGERVAPLNAALLRFLDAEFDTGFGEVTPAPDLRSP
jgi:hypothetical protein